MFWFGTKILVWSHNKSSVSEKAVVYSSLSCLLETFQCLVPEVASIGVLLNPRRGLHLTIALLETKRKGKKDSKASFRPFTGIRITESALFASEEKTLLSWTGRNDATIPLSVECDRVRPCDE